MKNLATCKPSEFLKQANRIKKAAEKWLTDTDILNIRKRMPALAKVSDDMSEEEKDRVIEANKKKTQEQVRANISAILDAIMDDHPDETLELLALACFVEPDHVDDYPISDYLEAVTDMICNQAVIGFFTSLARWGVTATPSASKA